jgi:hypothetical protein
MKNENIIICPNCKHEVDVSASLSRVFQEKYELEFNNRIAKLNSDFEKRQQEVESMKIQIEKKQSEISRTVENAVSSKLKELQSKLELKIRNQISTEKSDEIKSYQEQLAEKIDEVKSLNRLKAEYQKLSREKQELKEKLESEMQEKLSLELNAAKDKFKDEFENKSTMKIAEKDMLIKALKEQLEKVQARIDQGSTQVQGEAQEIVIEEFLQVSFPSDIIDEIKKGSRGADVLHKVFNLMNQECGSIYYESKRSNIFQKDWIEKLKKDMRAKKALFGVIVTDCMPKDMESLGQKNGIWICKFSEFKGLSFVLRESVLLLHQATLTQENKGGKMELLYQFLTGSEFRNHVEAIAEGFSQMNSDLDRERRAMEGLWKQREKQLQKVLINTSQMYHSIRGIAGNAIGVINQLNLPEGQKV